MLTTTSLESPHGTGDTVSLCDEKKSSPERGSSGFFSSTVFPVVPTTFFPSTSRPVASTESPPLNLETPGVTAGVKESQPGFWEKSLIFKLSVAAKLHEIDRHDIADTLDACHTIERTIQCTGCKKKRTVWNHCDNFFCPRCQPTLSRRRFESMEWWTNTVTQPKHVVLTVKNTDQFSAEYVEWFKHQFKKLRNQKFAKGWIGGMWSLEVTWSESAGWHLHLHALIDARWIDNSQLAIRWAKLVGQDFAIVHVKDARSKDYLKEVTKYTVKGSELAAWPSTIIAQFVDAMSGGRNFGVFGTLHGMRSKFSEWIESIRRSRGECECGCNSWEFIELNDWSEPRRILQFKPRPPPEKFCDFTNELPLNFQFEWPD